MPLLKALLFALVVVVTIVPFLVAQLVLWALGLAPKGFRPNVIADEGLWLYWMCYPKD